MIALALLVAVMSPKYQINLGYIARVSKNFGVKKLVIISPRCDFRGKQAIKYSKHARELLDHATVLDGLPRLGGNAFVVGTTGIPHKAEEAFHNVYGIRAAGRMAAAAAASGKDVVILLGRDDTGLSKEELRGCDATVFIEASSEYPVLNISHALAILLHEFSGVNSIRRKDRSASPQLQARLLLLFGRMVDSNIRIRDRRSVKMAFRHVLSRASPTEKEVNALSIAMAGSVEPKIRKRKSKGMG